MKAHVKEMLGYNEVMRIGKYIIYKSKDLNTSFCYVDGNHNKIKEPLYHISIELHNKSIGDYKEFNLRESEYNEATLKNKSLEKIAEHEAERREYITAEWNYRKLIKSIEPVNYQFKNVTLTVVTKPCYYSAGNIVTKGGTCYPDRKVIEFYFNGKQFYQNIKVLDVDAVIGNDLLLDTIFYAQGFKNNYTPLVIDKFKTIEVDMFAPFRIKVVGLFWKLPTESEPILISNVRGYSYNYGIAECDIYDINGKNPRRISVKLSDLKPENIVGELSPDSMLNLSILINKYQMAE